MTMSEKFSNDDYAALDELFDLLEGSDTDPKDEIDDGFYYLNTRKYAVAEPLFLSGIDKLEKMLDQLEFNEESLLAKMKTTGFNEDYVFSDVYDHYYDELDIARNGLKAVQAKLAQGIDEKPVEQAYQEVLQKRKGLFIDFWILTGVIIISTVLASVWLFNFFSFLVIVPIFVGAVVFFLLYFWVMQRLESLINYSDTELIDRAKQDGY